MRKSGTKLIESTETDRSCEVVRDACPNCNSTCKVHRSPYLHMICVTCYRVVKLNNLNAKQLATFEAAVEVETEREGPTISTAGEYFGKQTELLEAFSALNKFTKRETLTPEENALLLKFGFLDPSGDEIDL